MEAPSTIDTERLHLRKPQLSDAEWIFRDYATDPEVTRFLLWNPHASIEDTRHFLHFCHEVWRLQQAFPYVIESKETGKGIGMIEVRIDGHRAELGYVLAKQHWGHGFATEAARALVAWAYAQPQIKRIWAHCDTENDASAHVLEEAGLEREGLLRRRVILPNLGDEPRDVYSYAKVK